MNCLKSVTFSFVLLASTAAFAGQGAIGTWKLPDLNQNGLLIVSTITVAQDSVSSASTCTVGGQSASVTVSSPAVVSSTQITVSAQANKAVNVNGVDCSASLAPSTMDYTVSADDQTLTLSMAGQSFAVQRAN